MTALVSCGCPASPCLCDVEADLAAADAGIALDERTYLACVRGCPGGVEGGFLAACPKCGGALVPRQHKPLPGEGLAL